MAFRPFDVMVPAKPAFTSIFMYHRPSVTDVREIVSTTVPHTLLALERCYVHYSLLAWGAVMEGCPDTPSTDGEDHHCGIAPLITHYGLQFVRQ